MAVEDSRKKRVQESGEEAPDSLKDKIDKMMDKDSQGKPADEGGEATEPAPEGSEGGAPAENLLEIRVFLPSIVSM